MWCEGTRSKGGTHLVKWGGYFNPPWDMQYTGSNDILLNPYHLSLGETQDFRRQNKINFGLFPSLGYSLYIGRA
jgi:hypothetical protein